LTVGGNYTQDTGATFAANINADDLTAGMLDVSGTATFETGSIIEATITGTGYMPTDMDFIILDADMGITDNGVGAAIIDSDSVTIDLVNNPIGANTWALQLVRANDAYSAAASSGNNTSIGRSLDSLIDIANMTPSSKAGQLLGQLDPLDSATYNQAVAGLSPEPLNVTNALGVENSRLFTTEQAIYLAGLRSGVETRPVPGPPPGSMALASNDPLILAAAIAQHDAAPTETATGKTDDDPRWNQYIKLQGAFIDQDTTHNRTGFDATAFGGQIGIDYSFTTNFVAGMALGYSYTDADLNQGLGNVQDQTIRVGPYMSYFTGDWYIDSSLTFGWHFLDSDRTNPGIPGMQAHANYNAYDLTGYLGTGYNFMLGWDTYLTPIGSLLYSHFEYEGYTEGGNLGMPLSIPRRDSDSLRSRLGLNLSYRFPEMKFRPIPYFYLGWEHEFLSDDPLQASFAAGGSPFTVDLGSRATDAFFIGGGVNLLVNENLSAFIRFEGVTASSSSAIGVAAGVSVAF
jgi:outer membrane autotransporter protein